MANWHKRRSWKSGNRGERTTKTISSDGTTTRSTSRRVGGGKTRITHSISTDGRMRETITEYHPTLGSKRTTKTVCSPLKYKKPRTIKNKKPRRKANHSNFIRESPLLMAINTVVFLVIITALINVWLLIPLSIWLIHKQIKKTSKESVDIITKVD